MSIFKKVSAAMAPNVLPPSAFPTSALAQSAPQIIENRYIDDEKLLEICKERFGTGNYKLKVRFYSNTHIARDEAHIKEYKFHRWYLLAPCRLDEVRSQTHVTGIECIETVLIQYSRLSSSVKFSTSEPFIKPCSHFDTPVEYPSHTLSARRFRC